MMQRVMKKYGLIILVLAAGGGLLIFIEHTFTQPLPSAGRSISSEQKVKYETYTLAQSTVHLLKIPRDRQFSVTPASSPGLEGVADFAHKYQAIAVLNGGFFDPVNQQTNSYVFVKGHLLADPRLNARLMTNAVLAPYLPKILNRSELRQYICGSHLRYSIAFHKDLLQPGCELISSLGGGPRLLPNLTLEAEGFRDTVNGEVIRDPLGSGQANARSAVGITSSGSLVWVMVAQKPEAPASSGMSLASLATFLKNLGVKSAINLDGGSSSSFYYQGRTYYGKVSQEGNLIQRPVKSVLMLKF